MDFTFSTSYPGNTTWIDYYLKFKGDLKFFSIKKISPELIEKRHLSDGVVTTVSGYVVSGGDTTPKELFDAPRKFIFKIKEDDGSLVNISYTAYPPSSAGDEEIKKIRLKFHGGMIKIGDYLKACGTYNQKANVILITKEGDYIETYSEKP